VEFISRRHASSAGVWRMRGILNRTGLRRRVHAPLCPVLCGQPHRHLVRVVSVAPARRGYRVAGPSVPAPRRRPAWLIASPHRHCGRRAAPKAPPGRPNAGLCAQPSGRVTCKGHASGRRGAPHRRLRVVGGPDIARMVSAAIGPPLGRAESTCLRPAANRETIRSEAGTGASNSGPGKVRQNQLARGYQAVSAANAA
jgi:hypothetical protein